MDDNKDSLVIVDPVMGDDGDLYAIFDDEMCSKIKSLVQKSDIVTPNLTEALILIGENLNNTNLDKSNLVRIAKASF
ncbi:bifunctional hydroxymethylpyrimidine kinase/phosphomethylpyrimidine kinase [Paraclostridium bifermentans]|nr:bifunctional hydroxymethylpyrimidine kinase/phosphomethylpyrimidine kinase [Paraclostridium bifermentans]